MPKIGIRPTIDGRLGGVRESLETQTMNMAKAVAKLLTENLRHANGLPVECVIADGTIGRVAESAQCAEKFKKEGVGLTLTVTPCWCYWFCFLTLWDCLFYEVMKRDVLQTNTENPRITDKN